MFTPEIKKLLKQLLHLCLGGAKERAEQLAKDGIAAGAWSIDTLWRLQKSLQKRFEKNEDSNPPGFAKTAQIMGEVLCALTSPEKT